MTPMERALVEALRPFAMGTCDNAGYEIEAVLKARKLVERLDGQSEAEYRRLAPSVGADPDWYGKTFKVRAVRAGLFTVVGINIKATRNVMSIKDERGRVFRCLLSEVEQGMIAYAPAPRTRTRPGQRLLDIGVSP